MQPLAVLAVSQHKKTVNCVVTNDDIPPPPFVNIQTVKLRDTHSYGVRLVLLADVAHSSNIISGHVSISSPTGSSSDHLKQKSLMPGVQHAVTVNSTKTSFFYFRTMGLRASCSTVRTT